MDCFALLAMTERVNFEIAIESKKVDSEIE